MTAAAFVFFLVENIRVSFSLSQVAALLQLTGDLLSIVGKGRGKVTAEEEEEAEQAINRQTALYSLKLLCRSFASDHREAFVPVLLQTVELVTSPEEEKNVTGSALLCIAEVVSTLKALAIPHLPRSVSRGEVVVNIGAVVVKVIVLINQKRFSFVPSLSCDVIGPWSCLLCRSG